MTGEDVRTVEALLQRMVSINTVNSAVSGSAGAEEPLAAELERLALYMGFETRRMAVPGHGDNLLVTARCGPDKPWLMFECHMDTVGIAGMTIDPLGGEVREGRIWGRGSCDTKGSGAAMLWALRLYAASQPRPNNVAIAFTVDEEVGMAGVRSLIADGLPHLGFRPRGVIVGEPTQLKPIIAHNGAVRWCISTKGVAAHSSEPSRGRSAISAMVKVVAAIESRYIPSLAARDPLTGKAQCSINVIQGGTQYNIIPDRCEIRLDRRLVPGEDSTKVLPEVQSVLDSLAALDPTLQVSQELAFSSPPLSTRHNSGLLEVVQAALRRLRLPENPAGVPYATDAGNLDEAGIPALVIGPGDLAQAHTKDEYLEIDQLERAVELYLAMMRGNLA